MRMVPALLSLVSLVPAAGPAEAVVGHWLWVGHETLAFHADGRVEALKDKVLLRSGRWTLNAERAYRVTWTDGTATQDLQVSADGWTLTGRTAEGVPQRGERLDDGD